MNSDCATTLGETAGDLLSQTLNVGYPLVPYPMLIYWYCNDCPIPL
nr:hypothetical protein [Paenibacillus maysiensis]